jgi:hypothetical protein
MLGYLPGLLHAWYIISLNPERDYDYEPIGDTETGNSRVTYYYIRHEQPNGSGQGQSQSQGRSYGTQQPQQPKSGAPPVPQNSRPAAHAPDGPSTGAGSDEPGAPPSYSEVVRGDNKIQSQD